MEEWAEFFTFKSTQVPDELRTDRIEHVAGLEFGETVVASSSPSAPIIVQLFEKSCFLCFLMRPFLNSVAQTLNGVAPFRFVRLDIEENDFPDQLPVVRGTPTFVKFTGPNSAVRFEEFKPRDLVKRLLLEFPIPSDIEQKLFDLVDRLGLRFQNFSGLIMWATETDKIVGLLAGLPTDPKENFNQLVSEFMTEDMLKTDNLQENLRELSKELTQAEMHAIQMALILGQKVLDAQ